jgi:drug/metabolite transporter (DMT)-like permease
MGRRRVICEPVRRRPPASSATTTGAAARRASIVATWEVVTTALLGWLVFREHLTPVQLLGIALVCIGIAWIQRSET